MHRRATSQEMLKISKLDMSFEIATSRLQPRVPWANELISIYFRGETH